MFELVRRRSDDREMTHRETQGSSLQPKMLHEQSTKFPENELLVGQRRLRAHPRVVTCHVSEVLACCEVDEFVGQRDEIVDDEQWRALATDGRFPKRDVRMQGEI